MSDPTENDTPTPAQSPPANWQAAFLSALSYTGNVSAAARYAEANRQYCYECREKDAVFAKAWEEALVIAVERLEERAWKRALYHEVQYKFTKDGQPILHPETGEFYCERVGSDAVLLRLLEAHKPDLYKQRSAVEVNATVKVEPKYDLTRLSPAELVQLRQMQQKLLPAHEGGSDAG